jgi:hypothetical protein
MARSDCPVKETAEETVKLSNDLARSMRKLRRMLRECAKCGDADGCMLLQAWNSQVEAAVAEINQEWGMVG